VLNKIKSHNTQQVQDILLCAVAATMLYKLNIGNLSIIIAVIYNVIFFRKENIIKFKSFAFIFPFIFFVITVLSGVLSRNMNEGIRSIDLNLLLVLIVLIIANSNVNKRTFEKVFISLFYSSLVSVTILVGNALIKWFSDVGIDNIVFHGFTELYGQHPVYYAIILSLALFFVCLYGKYIPKKIKGVGVFILIIGIIFCASKAVLFINALTYVLFFIIKVKGLKMKFSLLFVIALTIGLVYNIPFINHRFVDGLRLHENILEFTPTNYFPDKKIYSYEEKKAISDLELRYIMASIGVYHTVKDGNILTGYGEGDVQDYLDYYYLSYNLAPNWNEGMNIHNQYLHVFITYGILTFIFFIGYLTYSFYTAIKHKDVLHIFFLVLLLFVFTFEVILLRNKGIIIFYFFNTLFLIKNIYLENSNFRHEGYS
jgi:hypothetical protein